MVNNSIMKRVHMLVNQQYTDVYNAEVVSIFLKFRKEKYAIAPLFKKKKQSLFDNKLTAIY